ncbi:MAG: RloB domain-containing protein [Halanaerobiales bacterium]|nr:RloB domain-containing protein [Halanaerobiales bacterium]
MSRGKRKLKLKRNKTIYIFCEGTETEPNYFQNYKKKSRKCSSINIPKTNPKCTDPINLINYAEKYIKQEGIKIDYDFGDRVWFVFDVDNNSDEKLLRAKKLAEEKKYEIILSNPSFEIWFLLHFSYTAKFMTNKEVMGELEKLNSGYKKNKDIFDEIMSLQSEAIKNAKRLNERHQKDGITLLSTKSNPSTQVFRMVEYLNMLSE